MTNSEKTTTDSTRPDCDFNLEQGLDTDGLPKMRLFDRPWNTLVVKRGGDGRYRTFVECCDLLLPA